MTLRSGHKHFSRPQLKRARRLALGEISIGKGHRYLTVVLDLDIGAELDVGDSDLESFNLKILALHTTKFVFVG